MILALKLSFLDRQAYQFVMKARQFV